MKVVCLIVDAFGIGAMPDAAPSSPRANTLQNICKYGRALKLPNLERLGLGNLVEDSVIRSVGNRAIASYGKMMLGYPGADTYMGHQILMGTKELTVEKATIRQLNTQITQHLRLNHKSVCPFPNTDGPLLVDGRVTVHDCMEAAPGLSLNITASLQDTDMAHVMEVAHLVRQCVPVTRVIVVCSDRFSFSDIARCMISRDNGTCGVNTPALCILDESVTLRHLGFPVNLQGQCPTQVASCGIPVYLIGKAADVVQCHAATAISLVDSKKIFSQVRESLSLHKDVLCIANIQETDLSGHAQDILRWADLLELVDAEIPELLRCIGEDGAFLLTGDHGNDPYVGRGQHTREMTPCLFYSRQYLPQNLGTRETLADIGATISDLFQASPTEGGKSLLRELQRIAKQ